MSLRHASGGPGVPGATPTRPQQPPQEGLSVLFPPGPLQWESHRSMMFDILVALGWTAAGIMLLAGAEHHPFGVPEPACWAVAVLMGLALIVRRHWPAPLCAAAVLATPVLLLISPLPVCLYSLAKYGRRRHLLVLSVAAALVVAAVLLLPDRTGLLPFESPVSFLAGPVLLGLYAGARRTVVENLREKAERLEREQYLLARQTRMEERTRIAREMHDVVAHRVSLMVIHSGTLEVGAAGSSKAAEAGRLIGDIGRQALDELHQLLAVLRLEESEEEAAPRAPQPSMDDLPALVEQSRATGMPVELTRSGVRRPLDRAAERTVYRLVQEALTNVHKHAGNAATRVDLRYGPDVLRLTVDNEKPTTTVAAGLPSGGNGLVGLRERVIVLGGAFEAARGTTADSGSRQ